MQTQLPPYRIVVGHDLDQAGERALDHAAALARRLESVELHVVHVTGPSSNRSGIADNDRRLEELLARLRARVAAALALDRGLTAHAHVRFGRVADTMIQLAVDYDADILVVGSRERSDLERMASDSASEELARSAPLPVLVAHPKDFSRRPRSERPEPAHPGEELHDPRALSQVVITPLRTPHISGLV